MVQENIIKPKVYVIVGATASGKSSLGVQLAQAMNGEIISADSVQVYKYFDIGSAKITEEEMCGIKHHNIDRLLPNEEYNAAIFCDDCERYIADILDRAKAPIIVGGTSMYIHALINGYTFYDVSDTSRREEYKKIEPSKLYQLLQEKSPDMADMVHPNNIKRVIRYLEIADSNTAKIAKQSQYEYVVINITTDRALLYERINSRVCDMLEAGLIEEVNNILSMYPNEQLAAMQSIGYKEVVEYINGNIDYDTMIEKIAQHTRNYAKRQITFNKKLSNAINIDYNGSNIDSILSQI